MKPLEDIRLTVLVDNRSSSDALCSEHGFSCLVEADGRRILFDTGAKDALLENSRRLGVTLSGLDAVVFSHGHYDHTGGLAAVSELLGVTRVVAHPDFMGSHHSRRTGSDRDIGIPAESARAVCGLTTVLSATAVEVCCGIWTTGEIPRITQLAHGESLYADAEGSEQDSLRDDMALVLKHRTGLVLLFGCAHAGVIDTMRHVERLFPDEPFLGILGGMHLDGAANDTVQAVASVLARSSASFIAPGHCTGDASIHALTLAVGRRVMPLRVGMEISLDGSGQVRVRDRAMEVVP